MSKCPSPQPFCINPHASAYNYLSIEMNSLRQTWLHKYISANDDTLIHIKLIKHITRIMEQSNRQKEAKNGNRSCLSAAIIDVVSHIGVFEEASSKAEFNGEFPNRIGLLPANFDDPTAVEVFLLNPATNAVCCLQEL